MTLNEALKAAQDSAVEKVKGSILGATVLNLQVQVQMENGVVNTVPGGSIVVKADGTVTQTLPQVRPPQEPPKQVR